MLNFMPGKKTYTVGVVMVVWGLASLFIPEFFVSGLPMAEDPQMVILQGLGLLGLRKAVEK